MRRQGPVHSLVLGALCLLALCVRVSVGAEAEVLSVPVAGGPAVAAEPLADTKKNRVRLAVRYLKDHPVEEMMDEILSKSLEISDTKQQNMIRAAMDRMDMKKIQVATRDALVRNMEVSEIKYLMDMYSTDMGKRVLKKMGSFMAEVNPVMNQEAYQALTAVNGGKMPTLQQKGPAQLHAKGMNGGISVPLTK